MKERDIEMLEDLSFIPDDMLERGALNVSMVYKDKKASKFSKSSVWGGSWLAVEQGRARTVV